MKSARDWVAVILAIGVAASIIAFSIAASVAEASKNFNLSQGAVTLLSTVLGAAVGAVASYIGYDVGRKDSEHDE